MQTGKLPNKTAINTIPVIIEEGNPLIYNGTAYQRATIDFSAHLTEAIWDNEEFVVLQQCFCSYEEIIRLHGYHRLARTCELPPLPNRALGALSEIQAKYCSGIKSVCGFKLHFDAAMLRQKTSTPPEERLQGIINAVMHHCGGNGSLLKPKIIKS